MTQEVCVSRSAEDELVAHLEQRLGRVHAQQRLGMERIFENSFNGGVNFFHPDKWYSVHSLIAGGLKVTGLYRIGARNAERVQVRHNHIGMEGLPEAFDGFTILHITDLHADMNPGAMRRLKALLAGLEYDICVLTGDFRGKAFGPFEPALAAMTDLCSNLAPPLYGVLGNHDTVRMLPFLEALGMRMLMNESETIVRGHERIHLAGVDDANYYAAANLEKAASGIPQGEFSILLSHTPEIYKQAALAGFQLFLAGHTHGGQICLPGSIPVTLSSSWKLPRRMGAGSWRYENMVGYTSTGVGASVVPVRFNSVPEIALHHLHCV